MAFAVTQIGGDYRPSNYREFLVDTVDDLATLPNTSVIAAGSVAYCSGDGNTYILENDGDWAVYGTSEGGSGGSSGGGLFIVHESVDEVSEDYVLDKTWQEIFDAMADGTPVVIVAAPYEFLSGFPEVHHYFVHSCRKDQQSVLDDAPPYIVYGLSFGSGYTDVAMTLWRADNANDYPHA